MLTFLTISHLKYQEPRDILNSQGVLVHPIKWKNPDNPPRWKRFSHHSQRHLSVWRRCLETVSLYYWATSHQPLFATVLVCNGQKYILLQRQTKMRNHPAQENNIKHISDKVLWKEPDCWIKISSVLYSPNAEVPWLVQHLVSEGHKPLTQECQIKQWNEELS